MKLKMFKDSKMLVSGTIGNVLEWYDFALYGYFASILAKQFFPDTDKTAGMIAVFGVFAAGFLMRPLGAVLFGHIGDRNGRKKALILSVLLMSLSTVALGWLPTYAQVGVLAPALLTLVRLLQGLSVGGELTTSITFISEISPSSKRGFYGSWTTVGAVTGILLGSATGGLMEWLLSAEQLAAFGWRIPFWFGLVLGAFSYTLRLHLNEPESFLKLQEEARVAKSPLREAFRLEGRSIIQIFLVLWIFAASFYLPFVYLPTYLTTDLGMSLSVSLDRNTIVMIFLVFFIMFNGWASDRFGRKRMLIIGMVMVLLWSWPMFLLLEHGTEFSYYAAMIPIAFFVGILQGGTPAFLCEQFEARTRVTAMSVAYNISLAIFGGFTPMISTWLISITGDNSAPAWFLMAGAVVSLITLLIMKEKRPADLFGSR